MNELMISLDFLIMVVLQVILFGGMTWYISKLENTIKGYELLETFSTSEVSGAKKRIMNFLNSKTDSVIYIKQEDVWAELNNKKALDKDLFNIAVFRLKEDGSLKQRVIE